MQQKLMTGLSTSLLLAMSSPGFAAEAPSWDYLSLEWVVSGDAEINGFEEDINGFRWDAAKGLGDFAILRAGSNAYYFEEPDSDVKLDIATEQFGAGAHYTISQGAIPIDLWGSANYERVSLIGVVGTGPGVDIGVRTMFSPAIEMGVTGKVFGDIDFGDVDADYTGYTVYGDFFVTRNMAIQASFSNYELDVDDTDETFDYSSVVGLGVRINY